MSLKISLKFVPKVRISNIPTLVQIVAWRRPGDKPLSEPMLVILLTHICVARPQWVNYLRLVSASTTSVKKCHQTIHYNDVIMGSIAPQITSLTIVYSNVYSGADQTKQQSYASLEFVVNSPHKGPVARKMFPFDDVIMTLTVLIDIRGKYLGHCYIGII